MPILLFLILALVALTPEAKTSKDLMKKGLVESTGSYTLDGSMVGARLRCQGYLCPQWVGVVVVV